MIINVAIVQECAEDAERIKRCLEYVHNKDKTEFAVTVFPDNDHLLFRSPYDFDLIFLDISLPDFDGIQAAKKCREQNETVGIVFVTKMIEYAIAGYEVDALDFIIKPVEEENFYQRMQRIISRLEINRSKCITIGTGNYVTTVPATSVLYLEVSGHYVTYYTSTRAIRECITLKEAENKFSDYPFFARSSRYCLVNMNYVDAITDDKVILGKHSVPLSRSQKTTFRKTFARHISGGGGSPISYCTDFTALLRLMPAVSRFSPNYYIIYNRQPSEKWFRTVAFLVFYMHFKPFVQKNDGLFIF